MIDYNFKYCRLLQILYVIRFIYSTVKISHYNFSFINIGIPFLHSFIDDDNDNDDDKYLFNVNYKYIKRL